MDLAAHFRKLFEYDAWANREVLRALGAVTNPPEKSVRFIAHIVAAEWLWLNRINSEPQRLAVWPPFSVAESSSEYATLPDLWLPQLDPSRMEAPVAYVNSRGEPWSSTLHDVLTHVVIHSAYHRGQIATDMRAHGVEPAYTDFVHATRQGLIG